MKLIGICLILILTLGLIGCSNSIPDPVNDSDAVYVTVLNDFKRNHLDGSEVELFVINSFTEVDKVSKRPLEEMLRNLDFDLPTQDADDLIYDRKPSLPKAYKEAMEDFKLKNKESKQLTKLPDLPQDQTFISHDDFRALMSGKNPEENWKAFYRKYPGSSGFILLSAVGFDVQKKHAFVYVEEICGILCAGGNYILLEKDSGIWKKIAQKNIWVS